MSSRGVEEVDPKSRRRVAILEETEDPAIEARDHDILGEQEVVETRPDSCHIARGWLRTTGAFVAVAFAVIETLLMFRFGFLLAGGEPRERVRGLHL